MVQDTTAPVLTIPADYTTECSEAIVYDDASASDNCSPVVLEEVSRVRVDGGCVGTFQMVRTFTATDDAGNSTTLVQTITVEDTTAPELTIPEDYVVECSDELVLDDALAVDNCSSCATEFDFSSSAADYGLSMELVAEHLDGELAGMETYRIYLDLASASDVVTSFSGSEDFALELNTTTSFYQHPLGAATPAMLSDAALTMRCLPWRTTRTSPSVWTVPLVPVSRTLPSFLPSQVDPWAHGQRPLKLATTWSSTARSAAVGT